MKAIKGKPYQALGVDAFKQWNDELWLRDLLGKTGFNFRWDAKSKRWRLWRMGLETNAYPAESKVEAKAAAIKYLVERGRIYAKWGNSNDTV